MKRSAVGTGLLVLPVIVLLGFAVSAAWNQWAAPGEVEMEGHGKVALLLGSLVTLTLAGVLIWLGPTEWSQAGPFAPATAAAVAAVPRPHHHRLGLTKT
jgi:hypothetical protein